MISFDEKICGDLSLAQSKEWLETNGLGGFASSTIAGINTRRYHALLIGARNPPVDRLALLSKLEETLILGGARYQLSTNQYPNSIYPEGYHFLRGFRLDPFPVFTFRIGEIEFEKTVFMSYGENTTVVRYTLHAAPHVCAELEVATLVAFRDYHHLKHETPNISAESQIDANIIGIRLGQNMPSVFLAHDAKSVRCNDLWYRNFEYMEEKARGFDYHEDLYNPCTFTFEMKGRAQRSIIASTERRDSRDAETLEQTERKRRQEIIEERGADFPERGADDYVRTLRAAADQFLVRRGSNDSSIIAGYHWFTDWGRDTMIALTGLTLATHKFDLARNILTAFAGYLSQGMIPNRFPDEGGEPVYNTVDATLWFVHAIGEYVRRTRDHPLRFASSLKEIITWHERGTRYGIVVDPSDGLLRAGCEGVQLTWMDAKVCDWVITPRTGKPVEIQGLWYNALRTAETIFAQCGDQAMSAHCAALADRCKVSFNRLFWNEATQCLYDVIHDDGTSDAAIRPNQIFAVSLPHAIVSQNRARKIVEIVERELLTPYGLRSLAPDDPNYCGRYEGNAAMRDAAYHQGTVWAWLMGPFITAHLNVYGRSAAAITRARRLTDHFRAHLMDAGLGQISEIFDGDWPHAPRGCIAQAWSVAELLRCELEELSDV
jgi:predicted glycogen debranching enzyme